MSKLKPCEKKDCENYREIEQYQYSKELFYPSFEIEGACKYCQHFKSFDLYEKREDGK